MIILPGMFYVTSTPFWVRMLFPSGLTWQGSDTEGAVYLTFDDGPHPEITAFVLDQLKQAGAVGTFFCIGENVKRYPNIFGRIKSEGHQIGNHTYNHLNGWNTSTENYLQNYEMADRLIGSSLFRPPFGKITKKQVVALRNHNPDINIVMWGAVTGDFDVSNSGECCTNIALQHLKPGKIIVMHDSEKAFPRLKVMLPAVLDYIKKEGILTACL